MTDLEEGIMEIGMAVCTNKIKTGIERFIELKNKQNTTSMEIYKELCELVSDVSYSILQEQEQEQEKLDEKS